jgi:hypothetical protein
MEATMTRAELRWVMIASLAVILLASLPTIYAWSLADADHVFTGFVYNTEDGNSYIAKMRLGARGEWLFHLVYTPEEHDGALVYTFYLLLGKLAHLTGMSLVLTYHLARVVLGWVLLLTVYAFAAHVTADVAIRRLAWALVAVGSGVGWLLTALGASQWLGNLPLDFWVPEAYVFLVLYSLPHLALAEALLLASLLLTLQAIEGAGWQRCLYAGLAAFFMAWIVPFYAGVVAAALGATLIGLALWRRHLPWREFWLAAVIILFTLPSVAYNAWVFIANPAFSVWAAQNLILSPHPLHYVLGYILLLVPATWAAFQVLRQRDQRWLLPLAWVLAVPFLVYLPFNLQRRMTAVAQVPLALLAARGLLDWLGRRRQTRQARRWAPAAYVAVASLSNLLLVAGSLGPIGQRAMPIYRSGGETTALAWLDAHSRPDETVLASMPVGNVIPAWTDLRVFVGHGPETLHSVEKQADVERFFQPETPDAWRQALLRDFRIKYIFYGLQEHNLGDWNPMTATYLAPIFAEQGYTIFRVAGE